MKYWNPIQKISKTESEIKQLYSNISFGQPFTPPTGWFVLTLVSAPAYNPLTSDLVEQDAIQVGQSWIQSWKIVNVSNIEAQRRQHEFNQAVKTSMINIIQDMLDSKAREWNYDNIFTAVTYADEPSVLKFQHEGKAFRAWRSKVWAKAYEILAEVELGTKPQPSVQELLNELPQFEI